MPETSQNAKVLCYYNPEVAESLRQVGLEVFPARGEASDRPVYDWAPALYVYAPQLVVAPIPDGGRRTYEADRELDAVFSKALKEDGARPLPQQAFVPNWTYLPPRLRESIKSGCILGVVFAAKVAVEDRRALLPWGAWREAARLRGLSTLSMGCPTGREVNLRRWRETWKVPVDLLSLAPSVEYTADLLKDLLPVLPPPTTCTMPVDGQTVSADSLRRERIARRRSDLGGGGAPGFHFKVEEPPMAVFPVKGGPAWASSLLPPDGLKVRVVIKAYHYDSAQKDTVQQAVAKMYQVDPSGVRIVPLFVNRLGDWLGVAVRIGKGAILILPEFPDEAAVVKRLVTDLWGPVHEWLAEQSRANTAGPPKPGAGPAQRVLPSLTAPSGPQIKAGSKMDTPKGSLDPPGLALEVERLFVQGDNHRIFAEQIEAFKREDAVRQEAEAKAEEAEHAAEQAIIEEYDAVKAGKAKARLTNPRTPPGEGWRWRTVHRGNDDILGWVPPDVAHDRARDPAAWPANPSLATMFALVSAFHDTCLPMNPPILPSFSDCKTLERTDFCALTSAGMWVVPAVESDAKRFHTIQGYVFHVTKHLEEETAARPALPQGDDPAAAEKADAPLPPPDRPDKKGFVQNPTDPAAYQAAAKICADHPTHAPTTKALRRILDQHPEIRRWKPTKQRLSVHLGDWHKYLEAEKNIAAKAAAEATKRPLWCCSACSKIYADLTDISSCPHCHKKDTMKPVAGRAGK